MIQLNTQGFSLNFKNETPSLSLTVTHLAAEYAIQHTVGQSQAQENGRVVVGRTPGIKSWGGMLDSLLYV